MHVDRQEGPRLDNLALLDNQAILPEPVFSLGTEAYARVISEAITTGNLVDGSVRRSMGRHHFLPNPVYVDGNKMWVPFRPDECF